MLRTKDKVRPVYVSVGHKADLDSAKDLVMGCCAGYRLPEPTRLADREMAAFKARWRAPASGEPGRGPDGAPQVPGTREFPPGKQ